ncbi:MAG: TetR-like C-terminal domain-containing protein [Mycobacterium sp.]
MSENDVSENNVSESDVSESDVTMRSAALDGALAEMQQWGVDRFSFEGVAHRSRLPTEYLRQTWVSERQLIIDTMTGYSETLIALRDTGSLHSDLTALALSLGTILNDPVGRRITRMFVVDCKSMAVDSETRVQFWMLRRKTIEDIFARAAARGELRGDADPLMTLQLLTSPLHSVALFTDLPVTPKYCRAIADMVTRAIRAG